MEDVLSDISTAVPKACPGLYVSNNAITTTRFSNSTHFTIRLAGPLRQACHFMTALNLVLKLYYLLDHPLCLPASLQMTQKFPEVKFILK